MDTIIFKNHRTRVASTSADCKRGIEVATILITAGGMNDKSFALYYNKTIIEESFSEVILKREHSNEL